MADQDKSYRILSRDELVYNVNQIRNQNIMLTYYAKSISALVSTLWEIFALVSFALVSFALVSYTQSRVAG